MKSFAVCSLLLSAALIAHAQDNWADSVVVNGYTPGTGISASFEAEFGGDGNGGCAFFPLATREAGGRGNIDAV